MDTWCKRSYQTMWPGTKTDEHFNHRVPDNCHDAIPLLRFNTWLYSCCVLLFPYAHLNFKIDPNACLIVNKIQFCDIFEEYNTSSLVIFVHTNVQCLDPIIGFLLYDDRMTTLPSGSFRNYFCVGENNGRVSSVGVTVGVMNHWTHIL